MPELTEDEWWEKEGFGLVDAYYTQYKPKDIGKALQGGGASFGGEYVNADTHLGIGGRFSMAYLDGDGDEYGFSGFLFAIDLFIPARISNSLTAYAGAGGALMGGDECITLKKEYARNIRGVGDHDMKFNVDGAGLVGGAFAGVRWRLFDHTYLFAEYRREFGKWDLSCSNYVWSNHDNIEIKDFDMGGDRFLVGLGVTF